MRALRSAGLTLASADRLAGTGGGNSVALYALGGLAILGLAGAGVFAMNLQAPSAPTPAQAEAPAPEAADPVFAMPQAIADETTAVGVAELPVLLDTPSGSELPWMTALNDAAPAPAEAPETVDCVAALSDAFSGVMFNFDPGSADIRPQDYDLLVSVGEQTAACPEARVLIAGHSDSSGSDALNLQLSWQRADSAVQVLDKLGIDVSQFETVGFGARTPLTQGSSTDEDVNRRIEMRVLREGGQL
ncbi:MAG: OmpA family protein [Pseudomonadota bacterium]